MTTPCLIETAPVIVPLVPVAKADLAAFRDGAPEPVRRWLDALRFTAAPASVVPIPGDDGLVAWVVVGLGDGDDPWLYGALPGRLPPGAYRIDPLDLDGRTPARRPTLVALAWALGTYAFDRYRSGAGRHGGDGDGAGSRQADLIWPAGCDRGLVDRTVDGVFLVRDLVNTPAADMGPDDLAAAARVLADRRAAHIDVIGGDDLLRQGYPAVHAVGRASSRPPCLIDLRWGDSDRPRVTLVGKGVCFDSGGLDLKPSSSMKLMKKDMGGAAHVLGLASMIMAADLPVRLRVLIPAVENAVAGNAMRPLDVLSTRKGITVEVGNTDAEGRLVLADALAEASAEAPALLLDCATLTGAARTALGTDIPALFSNDDRLAGDLLRHAEAEGDPLWRLPLHKPYRRLLDSKVADIANVSDTPHAGAILGALFLAEFVTPSTPWAHLDLFAWSAGGGQPGRVHGGEAQGLRAAYALIAERWPAAGGE